MLKTSLQEMFSSAVSHILDSIKMTKKTSEVLQQQCTLRVNNIHVSCGAGKMNSPQGGSIQRCKQTPIEICPVYSVALFLHFSPAPWEAGLSFILPYITLLNPPPKQQKHIT